MPRHQETEDTMLDEGGSVHTIPTIGPLHVCSALCWCHPELANPVQVAMGHEFAHFCHHVMH